MGEEDRRNKWRGQIKRTDGEIFGEEMEGRRKRNKADRYIMSRGRSREGRCGSREN
jgi:hypothetical protein